MKVYRRSEVYDDSDFFEKYSHKRAGGRAPNEQIEWPIIKELLGELAGHAVLELGCGDGSSGRTLLQMGAGSYHGIDNSSRMLQLATKELENLPKASLEQKDVLDAQWTEQQYDLVIARLVFHYLDELAPLLQQIYVGLKPGGRLIFSVEHPVITSCYDAYHQGHPRGNWIVDGYFREGERINEWLGKKVVKYHRTLETYYSLLQNAGFQNLQLRESKPERENFQNEERYNRRMRIPLFLFFTAQKG